MLKDIAGRSVSASHRLPHKCMAGKTVILSVVSNRKQGLNEMTVLYLVFYDYALYVLADNVVNMILFLLRKWPKIALE